MVKENEEMKKGLPRSYNVTIIANITASLNVDVMAIDETDALTKAQDAVKKTVQFQVDDASVDLTSTTAKYTASEITLTDRVTKPSKGFTDATQGGYAVNSP